MRGAGATLATIIGTVVLLSICVSCTTIHDDATTQAESGLRTELTYIRSQFDSAAAAPGHDLSVADLESFSTYVASSLTPGSGLGGVSALTFDLASGATTSTVGLMILSSAQIAAGLSHSRVVLAACGEVTVNSSDQVTIADAACPPALIEQTQPDAQEVTLSEYARTPAS